MVIAANNAVVNSGKLSGIADVSVCRKKIAAVGASVADLRVGAVVISGVENAISEKTIL